MPAHPGSPGKGPLNGCVCVCAMYILFACLYCMLPQLSFFFTFSYLSPPFPLRINLLHFQARCRKSRLNLALVFLCCSTFLLIDECMLLLC